MPPISVNTTAIPRSTYNKLMNRTTFPPTRSATVPTGATISTSPANSSHTRWSLKRKLRNRPNTLPTSPLSHPRKDTAMPSAPSELTASRAGKTATCKPMILGSTSRAVRLTHPVAQHARRPLRRLARPHRHQRVDVRPRRRVEDEDHHDHDRRQRQRRQRPGEETPRRPPPRHPHEHAGQHQRPPAFEPPEAGPIPQHARQHRGRDHHRRSHVTRAEGEQHQGQRHTDQYERLGYREDEGDEPEPDQTSQLGAASAHGFSGGTLPRKAAGPSSDRA